MKGLSSLMGGMPMQANYRPILKFALKLLQFFLGACYGLAIALLLSALFGGVDIVLNLLPAIAPIVFRVAVFVFFCLATAIMVESLR
jgi:4-hydroxybenzoate polyprenyltransferase